jgi:hypothetical protein
MVTLDGNRKAHMVKAYQEGVWQHIKKKKNHYAFKSNK